MNSIHINFNFDHYSDITTIAIGHPVGAGGTRITMTLMHALRRRCGGLSQGEAVLLSVHGDAL